jgi:hypothetical protein
VGRGVCFELDSLPPIPVVAGAASEYAWARVFAFLEQHAVRSGA